MILDDFFDGSAEAYRSHDGTRPARFRLFLAARREQLEEIGLGEATLRRCVLARIVVDSLPRSLTERLRVGHLTELAKVPDPATRAVLALASAENGWTATQLRDAALAARAGRWIDGDPDTSGIQPPAPETEDVRKPQLGRVVSRFERTAAELDALAGQWGGLERRPTPSERQRMEAVMRALEARVASMRRVLAD